MLCLSSWRDGNTTCWVRKWAVGLVRRKIEFNLRHMKSRHLLGTQLEYQVGSIYVSVEFKGEIWDENVNFGVISLQRTLKPWP